MLAELLADIQAHATVVEALAALLGVLGIAFSAGCMVDDLLDLRVVKREAEVGGPRWITARGHLLFSLAMTAAWVGYLHVALIAAYLPPRPDMPDAPLVTQVAGMRLIYAVFVLTGQLALRRTRWYLRSMPRERWAALFGDVDRWRLKYLSEHAELARAKSEIHELRAERHAREEQFAKAQLRDQLTRRAARKAGVHLPEVLEVEE